MSPSKPLSPGITKDLYPPSRHLEDIEDLDSKISLLESQIQASLINQTAESLTATLESQRILRKRIWKDKLLSSNPITLTTSLLQTLDQVLTSKEKDLCPFWNKESKETSSKLWLPTKTDSVGLALSSSQKSSPNPVMGKSWFSIQTQSPLNKDSVMTSFPSLRYSVVDFTDSEVIVSKGKSRAKPKLHKSSGYKTLKIRLFPNEEQKTDLKTYFEQHRWYYNSALAILHKEYDEKTIFSKTWSEDRNFRKLVLSHEYKESILEDGTTVKEFIKSLEDEEDNDSPKKKPREKTRLKPSWWSSINSRVIRGAICKLVYALDSAISNLHNGNISKFALKPKTKKDSSQIVHFDDSAFPKCILDIKSNYWYRSKDHKRAKLSFKEIFSGHTKRGCEIQHDALLDRYTLFYPIEYSWLPGNDLRSERQSSKFMIPGNKRIIALDPGLRKFLVGYDPSGQVSIFGAQAQQEIISLLLRLDIEKLSKQETHCLWTRIKNLVSEMHWKSIDYLISNYDVILYPKFETSKMIRSKKLSKLSKRIMNMFSFFTFKSRLEWKCAKHGKTLIIVDESYTSKTCGCCGELNSKLGSSEEFKCPKCEMSIDRDVNGARNILLKNLRLR